MQPNERFIGASPSASRAPRYPEKSTFLRPEEQAEFGVQTVHEMVVALNAAWAKEGRRALAPGSFPTTRILLKTVLREMTLAREAGLLDR